MNTRITPARTLRKTLGGTLTGALRGALRGTLAAALACSTLVPGFVPGALAQDEAAKWFVLRQETTNACRTALLIPVNGEYAHGFENIAGRPFDTESEALAREKALERDGTCVKAS